MQEMLYLNLAAITGISPLLNNGISYMELSSMRHTYDPAITMDGHYIEQLVHVLQWRS